MVPFFEAHRRFVLIGVGLCVIVAVWVGLNTLIAGALSPYFPQGAPTWVLLLASSGPLYAVAMPMGMFVFSRVPSLEVRRFPLGVGRFFTLLIICFPIMSLGGLIGNALSDLVSGGNSTNRVSDLILAGDWWVNALFVAVLAPVFEEWMFRKQIIDRTRRYGERTSIVLSAFAFALFHMNLYQFFYAFGIGLVLGYVYMRTGRLRYSIIMHMIINANGSVLAPFMLWLGGVNLADASSGALSEQEAEALWQSNAGGVTAVFVYYFVLMALIIAGIVLFCVNVRKLEFYDPPEQLPKWYGARLAFLNPAMIVYIVVTTVFALWQMGILFGA